MAKRHASKHEVPAQREAQPQIWRQSWFWVHGLKTLGLVSVALVLVSAALYGLHNKERLFAAYPIERVQVTGELYFIDKEAMQASLSDLTRSNYFEVDLQAIRDQLLEMNWVQDTVVRRLWPDTLVIHVQERLPVARWQDDRLVSNFGDVFMRDDRFDYDDLPLLSGAEAHASEMMDYYKVANRYLRGAGHQVNRLKVTEDYRWEIEISSAFHADNVVLVLGDDPSLKKLSRFHRVYERLTVEQQRNIQRVDLRYSHGLAVQWIEKMEETALIHPGNQKTLAFELANIE